MTLDKLLRLCLGCVVIGGIVSCQDQAFDLPEAPRKSFKNPGCDSLSSDCGEGGEDGKEGNEVEPGKPVTETFFQDKTTAMLDILFVVDTSLSTRTDRWHYARKLSSFFKAFKGVDWQMGVTTTAFGGPLSLNGSLYPWGRGGSKVLRFTDKHRERDFKNTVGFEMCDGEGSHWSNLNPCASGSEDPSLAASLEALKKVWDKQSLVRQGASLAIVYLSDEDEGPKVNGRVSATYTYKMIKRLYGEEKTLSAYGVIIEPGDKDCLKKQSGYFEDSVASYGTAISEMAKISGGGTISICDRKYDSIFSLMRRNFDRDKPVSKTEFALSKVPLAGEAIEVSLNPKQDISWSVEGSVLRFERAPATGTLITVKYQAL